MRKEKMEAIKEILALCGFKIGKITLNECRCDNCHTVFYVYAAENICCPECGAAARILGEVTFIYVKEEG